MPKCWIHSQTAEEKPKPLKTHSGIPDPNFRQDLALCLASKPPIRDLAIQPYRHWEFEVKENKISGLEKTLKTEKENNKKREEELLEEIKTEKENLEKWKNVLTQFLTKYNINSGKLSDLGAFLDNLILRDKKVGEFLARNNSKNLKEVSEKVQKYNELLSKIELLEFEDGERERERERAE